MSEPTPSMTYSWNRLWADVVEAENAGYQAAVRRMIMASINWLAAHPRADPKWREVSKASLARAAGVPAGTPLDEIQIIGAWEEVYQPTNSYARHWFREISNAAGSGSAAPSAFMFGKAIACGMLFKQDGWDKFDAFMSSLNDGEATRQ